MTHNERVLELLSDRQPHSHLELYDLHVIAHSRIADLRRHGNTIECWRDDDLYWYRLLDQRHDGGFPAPSLVPLIEEPDGQMAMAAS